MRKVVLGSLLLVLFGCEAITTEDKVYGSYDLTSSEAGISLRVMADHTYSEIVEFKYGGRQGSTGKWHWADGRACFGAFLVPKGFMKDLFQDAQPDEQPRVVGGAYQLDHCLPAGREYGRTVLELNPDGPENFVMVSSAAGAP